jgi:hypothetical protein
VTARTVVLRNSTCEEEKVCNFVDISLNEDSKLKKEILILSIAKAMIKKTQGSRQNYLDLTIGGPDAVPSSCVTDNVEKGNKNGFPEASAGV